MPTPVLLPHGKTVDLDAVTVIRSVSDTESTSFNERMAMMPGGTGVISERRWTVALEVKGETGIQNRYNLRCHRRGAHRAARVGREPLQAHRWRQCRGR